MYVSKVFDMKILHCRQKQERSLNLFLGKQLSYKLLKINSTGTKLKTNPVYFTKC